MNRSQSNKPEGLSVLERVNSEGAPSRILAAAKSAVASGRLEEAAGLLDDRAMRAVWAMVEQNPGGTDLVCDLAMILLKIGRKSEVEECCNEV